MGRQQSDRRPYDTAGSYYLRQAFVHIAFLGLLGYAMVLIGRLYYLPSIYQSKPVYLKDAQRGRRARGYEPDIIFCMSNATLLHKDDGLAYSTNLLKDSSIPPGYKVESLCDINVHDTMFVFWYQYKTSKKDPWPEDIYYVDFEDLTKEIEFRTNSTAPIKFIVSMPSERYEDRYREPEIVESESVIEQDFFNAINTHFVQPRESTTYVNVFPRIVKRLMPGLRGVFGNEEPDDDIVITSNVETLHTPGITKFVLRSPVMWHEDQEMLLKDFSSALASWGGVFSLVATVYHLLFGNGLVSPFGLVQTFFLKSQTKSWLQKHYGNKIKGGIDSKDEIEDGVDPKDANKEEPGVSSSSLAQQDSSDETIENLGIASPPFGQARTANAQDVDREQTLPLGFLSENTLLRNRHAVVSSDQRDSSQTNVHPESPTEARSLEERLERQEDELALLRALVYEELLPRLQEHEQRSRSKETLIKGLFLDMGIVDEALADPKPSSPVTEHEPENVSEDQKVE
ncbi:MAG: hypothetical protein J3Q66DRAFT_383128 [Benniella sp.]|nr:MAG: hypothetical protein J3Q66DRAFT_383128 [Benniella sp.]